MLFLPPDKTEKNMHCRYCKNEVVADAHACNGCGCAPLNGNKYCNGCGVETNVEQVMCINCGVQFKNFNAVADNGKTVAILSYLTILGFIIALSQHNSNKTELGAYHLRQSLGVFLGAIGLSILAGIASTMGRDADIFLMIVMLVSLGFGVSSIISFFNAVSGKIKPAPFLGEQFEKWFEKLFN
jgi:hypothetical protein